MQAIFRDPGKAIDYTPSTAVTGGDVVLVGDWPCVAKLDIAANAKGALAVEGVFEVVKDTSIFEAGDAVNWDADGDPLGGTANSGAATLDAGDGVMGRAVADAAADDGTVLVKLMSPPGVESTSGS